ncbi:cation:proton antiporter [Leptolyngbya sp. FACHB-16]|uniref:cation:proton antiporter n=1 Tax=unclassified Leptolyngbya TaxID=2650499 RepID=UPI0016881BCC|nr:cation:proton antiporter [Leptolyngbya sp. FACHB-16]MBD2156408.1 cation:proton antiporter [Leptolyngbya sp. FACHB-16]
MNTVVLVLIDVVLVIGLSRLVGLAFRRIRQPLVIGEIVAGIMLGPSLLGWLTPTFSSVLFPPETVPYLNILSQVGLIFFMFLIGLELDPKYLKSQLEAAILTSHASILLPFSLGTLGSLIFYPLVSNGDVSFTAFALFLGAAMSITAFPVLARIITENNLQSTRLGTLALTCAAVDDVTAWCLLALSIAVAKHGTITAAIPTVILAIIYIALMFTVGRKFLSYLSRYYRRRGRLNQFMLAAIYIAVVVSAIITELIGIHLIFGAFLVGAVMPKDVGLTRELAEKTEDFVLTFLLPIFFAYSGLRTQIGLLNSPVLWLLCGLIVLIATAGKYIGAYSAARFCGIQHREASALGWLMNTRGLTELIVLNIGLSLHVISPLLFTMLVIMALVTTVMTSPLLEWTYPKHLIRQDVMEPEAEVKPTYKVLVPIANPRTQQGLIQLALAIAASPSSSTAIYPLNLLEADEDAFAATPSQVERKIVERKTHLHSLIDSLCPPPRRFVVRPIVQMASDVAQETTRIAEQERADLILMGWHRPTFSQNRLGGRVGQILTTSRVDVAVFVDQNLSQIEKLLVPYMPNIHNDLGLEIALRLLINHPKSQLTILRVASPHQPMTELTYEFELLMRQLPDVVRDRIQIPIIEADHPVQAVAEASYDVDLTIAGASREWGVERQTLGIYTDELVTECRSSLLITRKEHVTFHITDLVREFQRPQAQDADSTGASV